MENHDKIARQSVVHIFDMGRNFKELDMGKLIAFERSFQGSLDLILVMKGFNRHQVSYKASLKRTINSFEITKIKPFYSWKGHLFPITKILATRDGFCLSANSCEVGFWRCGNDGKLKLCSFHNTPLLFISWIGNSKNFLTINSERNCEIFSFSFNKPIMSFPLEFKEYFTSWIWKTSDSSLFLFIVDKVNFIILYWKIDLKGKTASERKEISLEEGEIVKIVDFVDYQSDYLNFFDQAIFYVIYTGVVLKLTFYRDEERCSIQRFVLEISKYNLISASSKGYLAMIANSSHRPSLFIDRFQDEPFIQKIHKFSEHEIALKLRWNILYEYHEILTVATNCQIYLFYLCKETQYKPTWNCLCKISLHSFVKTISNCCFDWMCNGVLLCGFGNVIMEAKPSIIFRGESFSKKSSLMDVLENRSKALPDYHPTVLLKLFNRGQYQSIKTILFHLFRFLKESDSHERIVKVPMVPMTTFMKSSEIDSVKQVDKVYEELFTVSFVEDSKVLNPGHVRFLREFREENSFAGLSNSEQSLLVAFTEAFVEVMGHQYEIDENGMRFLFSLRLNSLNNSAELVSNLDICWALHSETQSALTEQCLKYCSSFTWTEFTKHGMGYWIQNLDLLVD